MKIKSIQHLIQLLKPIPPSQWCVDIRTDSRGRHCVLGHIDKIVNGLGGPFSDGDANVRKLSLSTWTLANVNNGFEAEKFEKRKFSINGRAIKTRVLKYLSRKSKQIE